MFPSILNADGLATLSSDNLIQVQGYVHLMTVVFLLSEIRRDDKVLILFRDVNIAHGMGYNGLLCGAMNLIDWFMWFYFCLTMLLILAWSFC